MPCHPCLSESVVPWCWSNHVRLRSPAECPQTCKELISIDLDMVRVPAYCQRGQSNIDTVHVREQLECPQRLFHALSRAPSYSEIDGLRKCCLSPIQQQRVHILSE